MSDRTSTPFTVPDHELLQPIGRGSYGEVWLARNALGTLRAVKIVRRADFSNPRPFEREFAGIQHVEPLSRAHEGLVDILQVGRDETDEFFYYVMELADAAPEPEASPRPAATRRYSPRSLASDLTARGRLPIQECIDLFHSLALALAHLHRAGLVHRDIKPSNIIFVGGVAKLADIGLVAFADDSQSYVGTEGFIPPEGAGTVAADIYSLGKVLYEAGTGKDRSEFPSLRLDECELGANAGLMELNAVWLKACANKPDDRYQNVDELAADLALLRAGRSVKRLRVVEGRLRRARQFGSIVAGLALLVALGWFMSKREAGQERRSRHQADLLRDRAEAAEREARDLLSEARIAEARAVLQSQQLGRRGVALSLLTNQIYIHHRVEARSLAATALALPDLVPVEESLADSRGDGPVVEGRADGSILVKPVTGEPLILPNQGEPLREPFVLSGDGRFLYAPYGVFTERIWDLSDGRLVARLDTNYYHLAFRPGHLQAAVAYVNGDLVLHDLPGWEVSRVWTNVAGDGPMSWTVEGRRLFSIGAGHHLWIADAETGNLKALGEVNAPIELVAWHPDGKHLLIAADDGYVRVQDVETWPEYAMLTRHDAQIVDAVFLPPFPWLLTSSWDGTSKLWDWQAGHELGRLEATGSDLTYDATSRLLHWRLANEPKSRPWRPVGGEIWRQFFHGNPREPGGPFMAAFSGDSRWVATPDIDGIRVWHIESGTEALFLPGYSQAAWLNSDGTELFANFNDGIRQWHLTSEGDTRLRATEVKVFGTVGYDRRLALSADGSVMGWIDGSQVRLVRHGTKISWNHDQPFAEALEISPDGTLAAVGTRNRRGARIFNTATGGLLWHSDIGFGTHLSFSADSKWLALGTDHGCQVFSANSGVLRWRRVPLPGQEPSFWETAFSPDGAFVAWTPKPSQVQLLNASDGSEVMTLNYPTRRYITRLAFSPDGRWLAETSSKHILHLWNLRELRRELGAFGLAW